MNVCWYRILKELRALASVWSVGVVGILGFALLEALAGNSTGLTFFLYSHAFIVYGAVAFVMGAMCFGSEFGHGTILSLISQPANRIEIWREKMLALFILLGGLYLIFCGGLLFHFRGHMGHGVNYNLTLATMILVCAGVGGPLFSLFLRRTYSAVFVSVAAPWVVIFVLQLLDRAIEKAMGISFLEDLGLIVIILLWYVLGYLLARRRFLNLEVESSDRREKGFMGRYSFGLSEGASSVFFGSISKNRWGAVVAKELHLQKSSLLFALFLFVICLLYIGLASGPEIAGKGGLWTALPNFLYRPCMFFFLPLSIGACAVASERENAVFGWQHSQPFSRRFQWALKVLVCLSLTALFSCVIGVNLDRAFIGSWEGIDEQGTEPANYWFGIKSLGVAVAALYASSMARSTIRALVGGIVLCWLAAPFARTFGDTAIEITRAAPPLLAYLVIGIATALLYVMAYRNYILEQVEKDRVGSQIYVWILVFFICAMAKFVWTMNTRYVYGA